MIVAPCFHGDTCETLQMLQHDTYHPLLAFLVRHACDAYLCAARLLAIETPFVAKVRSLRYYDHRTLQVVHDFIAALFRFEKLPWQMQLSPIPQGENLKQYLSVERTDYWHGKVKSLCEDGSFIRGVLTAVVDANTTSGYDAEELLLRILSQRYYAFAKAQLRYRKVTFPDPFPPSMTP